MPKPPLRVPALRRRLGGGVFILALLAASGSAHAQNLVREGAYRSPRSWAFELKGGPYGPDVDAEFSDLDADERPHAKYFGNKRRVRFGFELDYQFFQRLGSLAVGFSAGYTRERARAFVEPEPGQTADERSSDPTSLTLYPTSLSLVYRFDLLARRLQIPLVPYGKVGLDYVFWVVGDGNGATVDPPGDTVGWGTTPGWHAVAGVALLLDILDPGAAQELDAEVGVNATYVFGEVGHYDISGLGQSGRMNLSDTTWQVGLMFEF